MLPMLCRFVMLYTIKKQGGSCWRDVPLLLCAAVSVLPSLPAAASVIEDGCVAGCCNPVLLRHTAQSVAGPCSLMAAANRITVITRLDALVFYCTSQMLVHAPVQDS